jgi:dolichol-phosphate mannosyltransferase
MAKPPRRGEVAAPELSVVLPTRNEAGNIAPLLSQLQAALEGVSFELIFVDDSDDHTSDLVERASQDDDRVRLLHRAPGSRQGGLSTAVVLGLREARGRLVCVMDADLQHPPETIPRMLQAEAAGADLVVASRYQLGSSRRGLAGGLRQVVSRSATLLVRAVFLEARASSDPLAGFFVCRASLLRGLELRPVGFKILLELLVCSPGIRVRDVPLQFLARTAGVSKVSTAQGLLFLRHVWSLIWDVPGSARRWKYALVGASGLLLLLALLELCGVVLGWAALAAWAVAFIASVLWNFSFNLRLTFADLRREHYPLMLRYISSTIIAGAAQFAVFLGLVGTKLPLIADGLVAAVVGMLVNGTLNRQLVQRQSRPSVQPLGLDRFRAELARVTGAERVAVLDARGRPFGASSDAGPALAPAVADLVQRAGLSGLPILWTEPPSSRPQARANVESTSLIVLPLDLAGYEGFTVALQRRARSGFSSSDLEAAMRSLRRLRPRLGMDPADPGQVQLEAEVRSG